MVPVAKWLNAANGTTVSAATLTAVPVEVLPRPAFARELSAALRAASPATAAADAAVEVEPATVAADVLVVVVPATAWVLCVPLTAPPDVLRYSSFNTSGLSRYCGAISMTTWYCCGLKGL